VIETYYFGCYGRLGHYLYERGGSNCERRLPNDFPVRPQQLDTGFLPKGGQQIEGIAHLYHVNGWTVVSFWDRTVDSRHGSNSSFVVRGVLDFDAVMAAAKEAFPEVCERFTFDVRLPPTPTDLTNQQAKEI